MSPSWLTTLQTVTNAWAPKSTRDNAAFTRVTQDMIIRILQNFLEKSCLVRSSIPINWKCISKRLQFTLKMKVLTIDYTCFILKHWTLLYMFLHASFSFPHHQLRKKDEFLVNEGSLNKCLLISRLLFISNILNIFTYSVFTV